MTKPTQVYIGIFEMVINIYIFRAYQFV